MTSAQRTVLISGANKGIGLETARQLAAEGYRVYVGTRDLANGQAAIESLHLPDADLRAIQLDVTDAASVAAAAAQIDAEVGQLDVLINNAGIAIDLAPPSQVGLDKMRQTYDVNVYGPITLTQAMLPLLRKAQTRVVVNLSSELGSTTLHGYPDFAYYGVNLAAYNMSKAALNMYTVLLAKELRDEGFHINAINPGYTATDLNNHQGTRSVQQAAAVVVKYATLDKSGPNGGFYTDGGAMPW
ncbi:SDR family oxidoreductase [Amantichitinum ursilacus]|uniref:3-oxoacyl-[acyl-carrier-protein] reductase FabG n=1 Tax=Amantichitinum ursilacus TaxID=857265 RepID=A0A0N0XHH7_9NEIS|nr:SDR family oxidoreductase [Amantichitinum ursilacus]KPC49578.1 3-oxoacyl-[acyl-carrier-protein] reductase FabG [Amantichitinum ursilacus]